FSYHLRHHNDQAEYCNWAVVSCRHRYQSLRWKNNGHIVGIRGAIARPKPPYRARLNSFWDREAHSDWQNLYQTCQAVWLPNSYASQTLLASQQQLPLKQLTRHWQT